MINKLLLLLYTSVKCQDPQVSITRDTTATPNPHITIRLLSHYFESMAWSLPPYPRANNPTCLGVPRFIIGHYPAIKRRGKYLYPIKSRQPRTWSDILSEVNTAQNSSNRDINYFSKKTVSFLIFAIFHPWRDSYIVMLYPKLTQRSLIYFLTDLFQL